MGVRIQVDEKRIAEFCQRNGIRRLAFFGSVLRDDFGSQSDVDVLVEFEPGQVVGMLRMAGLEEELSAVIGRKVDLRTARELSRYFRDEVVAEAYELYAA